MGPLVINLFGGPGCGKSTTAAGIFYELKQSGKKAELVQEYAKDLTWEKRFDALANQAYVFAKQLQRMHRIKDQVDYIVTDSPLLLSLLYLPEGYPATFRPFVLDIVNGFNNANFVLNRTKAYEQYGRTQTEEEAKEIDRRAIDMLDETGQRYSILESGPQTVTKILDISLRRS